MSMNTNTTLPREKAMKCSDDGAVVAKLVRGLHKYGDVEVRNALAYVCPKCGTALAFPQASAGRIAKALRAKEPPEALDFRVPASVEDSALAVHAALGTLGAGEDFTLPLHLGLQIAGREQAPSDSWKVFDGEPCEIRARPRLTASTARRLKGLAAEWHAESVSDVVRWLLVAASLAVAAGLIGGGARESAPTFPETRTIRRERQRLDVRRGDEPTARVRSVRQGVGHEAFAS
jgi:hypothetical protein